MKVVNNKTYSDYSMNTIKSETPDNQKIEKPKDNNMSNKIIDYMDYQGNLNKVHTMINSEQKGLPRSLIDKYAQMDGYKAVDYYDSEGNHIIYESEDSCIDELGHVLKKHKKIKYDTQTNYSEKPFTSAPEAPLKPQHKLL